MSLIRTIAPQVQPIEDLHFYHAEPSMPFGENVLCYRLPQRELGVVKLDIYWPFGTKEQQKLYQSRTSLSLSLSGTDKLSAEQIHEEFEFLGSSVTFDTQLLNSTLQLKSSKDQFINSLSFLLENFVTATFPENELVNFKQIEQASLQRKMQTPKYWSHRLCYESLFPKGSVMASFAGSEDIANIQKTDLALFHKAFLHPGQATYILSGDADDALFKEFSKVLNNYLLQQPKTKTVEFAKDAPMPIGITSRHHVEHTNQVSLYMGRTFDTVDEVSIHQFALLNILLGGFFGSRLMQEIREEKGLTYGIGSFISQTTAGNIWAISGEMNNQNAGVAIDAIQTILDDMVKNPPSGEELERAKRYYCGQLRGSFDGPFAMTQKLRYLFARGYTYNHFDSALQTVWKTTTDDLCAMADNYLSPDSFNTVLAGDV